MEFPQEKEAKIFIDGPVGRLEALTTVPSEPRETMTVAVICHPNPLFQGTMFNKVVTTLMKAFNNKGCYTVRFNYRGVGESEGVYGELVGECDDALAVVDWVKQCYPNARIMMGGFSFGCYVAANAALKRDADFLVTVAPPVEKADFTPLAGVKCPWHVVQGDADEIVTPQAVYDWVEQFDNPVHLHRMEGGVSHFFHQKLVELRELLEGIIP